MCEITILECSCAAMMAYQAPTPKFSPGDLVNYRGSVSCLVVTSWSQLGFNKYQLLDLDT